MSDAAKGPGEEQLAARVVGRRAVLAGGAVGAVVAAIPVTLPAAEPVYKIDDDPRGIFACMVCC